MCGGWGVGSPTQLLMFLPTTSSFSFGQILQDLVILLLLTDQLGSSVALHAMISFGIATNLVLLCKIERPKKVSEELPVNYSFLLVHAVCKLVEFAIYCRK